ncbi:angiopoietin-1 receptor-like [Strongylocentrotus purpuratus]|uniref:Fibronectin type-III domain-containing protein n=1 Tax=Strongylocentrotus purpuratus TaxID=7668 RepID=A0A7M7NZV7_STRPU|nr:angiopoietin-1 receptor-like [Strongylocentrotus purpuratus]
MNECEGGTFGIDCLQQCQCAAEACETERGHCNGQCLDSWFGPYCQRISRLVPVRVNPYQPSSFTCYVEGIPLPDASSVDLYRRTGDTNNRTGITMRSSTVSGSERAVVFDVDSVYPLADGGYQCILTVENTGYPSTLITNATYAMLKQEGKGVVTHKPAISAEDMDKIQGSLDLDDPVGLQDKAYTHHCLRATSISTLQNAGFREREIMSVSGHKAETSLKHYAMTSSTAKENMSHAIAAAVDPKSVPSSSNIGHGIAAAVDPKSVPSSSTTSTGGQRSESQELRELNDIFNEITNNPENFPRTCNITTILPVIEKAPVILSTTSTTVGLRWNEWSEEDDVGDPPLVGYDVFVKKDGDWVTDQRVDQLTTSAIVSNLTPDTDYRFCVAAVREGTGGTGPESPRSDTITLCRKPSASPTGLQVSAINPKELEVTWEHLPSESAECRSGVTHYIIYYAPPGSTSSNSILVFRDTSSYTIRGLDTYLDYTIQLTALNKDEEGDKSSETMSKTLEEVAPAPINVTILQSTTSSFTLSWSTPLPSNINGNIQKYIIRYKRTDLAGDGNYKMEEVMTGAFDVEHTVMDLASEINYTVQVQTLNGAGFSNWSVSVNAKTILSGDDNGSRKPLSAVIGGVIVPIVLIAILLITLVMYRRIKQRRLETEPAASPPNNARETSSKYKNPVFDDSKQDRNTYEDPNADTHVYQDLNTDTPNYQNLTDPHTYQDLKKPNTDDTYLEPITSDPRDTYEEI